MTERAYTNVTADDWVIADPTPDRPADVTMESPDAPLGFPVWRAWYEEMVQQGRHVAPERRMWETLPEQDKQLDAVIEARVAAFLDMRRSNVQPDRPADVTALRDALVPHDSGCQCWPHVSKVDAERAIERVALLEYRSAVRADATRATDAEVVAWMAYARHRDGCIAQPPPIGTGKGCSCGLLALARTSALAASAALPAQPAAPVSDRVALIRQQQASGGGSVTAVMVSRSDETPAAPDIRERVETEWVNGNVDTAARDRILAGPDAVALMGEHALAEVGPAPSGPVRAYANFIGRGVPRAPIEDEDTPR